MMLMLIWALLGTLQDTRADTTDKTDMGCGASEMGFMGSNISLKRIIEWNTQKPFNVSLLLLESSWWIRVGGRVGQF